MPNILIGTPVRQKPQILSAYLYSLSQLNKGQFDVDYCFIDDNESRLSSELLKAFAQFHPVTILPGEPSEVAYKKTTESQPHWKQALIWKVANYRNQLINTCLEGGYDGLFMVDSDLILSPETLRHLHASQKEIISEIFWTQWRKDELPMPQVWMYNEYDYAPPNLPQEERDKIGEGLMRKWQQPGIYPVGGLGACTYFSRTAFEKGANYNRIPNLSFWGEDRHFCIRAGALGIPLHVDTHYPALHLFNPQQFSGFRGLSQSYPEPESQKRLFILDALTQLFTITPDTTGTEGVPYLSEAYLAKRKQSLIRSVAQAKSRQIQMYCFPFQATPIESNSYQVDALQVTLLKGEPKIQTNSMRVTLAGEKWAIDNIVPIQP